MPRSDKWDRLENDRDLFNELSEETTQLELLLRIKEHVKTSGKYTPKDIEGLLKAAERDIDRVFGV